MKHTKKILAVLSAAAIAASMSAPAFAADTPKDAVEEIPPVIETLQIGDNVYLLNVELLLDGISCIMMETETRAGKRSVPAATRIRPLRKRLITGILTKMAIRSAQRM